MLTCSLVSCVVEYPIDFLSFLIPKAVTTTSDMAFSCGFMVILIVDCSPMLTSWLPPSTEENTRVLPEAGTESEYVPSTLLTVPDLVPLMRTETLARGLHLSSVTNPVIVRCAHN